MSSLRPEATHRGQHVPGGWRGVWVPLALVWGRSVWSPHGLGVRREDESAVGAGRRRRSQAMWGGNGKFS
jgi:hypothetical protein